MHEVHVSQYNNEQYEMQAGITCISLLYVYRMNKKAFRKREE